MNIGIDCYNCGRVLSADTDRWRGLERYTLNCDQCRHRMSLGRDAIREIERQHALTIRATGQDRSIDLNSLENVSDIEFHVPRISAHTIAVLTCTRCSIEIHWTEERGRPVYCPNCYALEWWRPDIIRNDPTDLLEGLVGQQRRMMRDQSRRDFERIMLGSFDPSPPDQKKPPPSIPKPSLIIPEYMKKDYSLIPSDIREQLEQAQIYSNVEIPYEMEQAPDAKKHVDMEILRALTATIMEQGKLTVTEHEREHANVKQVSAFLFDSKELVQIIIKTFYAGVDYAQEQNKEEPK